MVVSDAIHNIMGGLENAGDVRLHNHRRKLKQRFDIVKKLGQGTYGKVQLGINKETGQEVAIKTIRKCKIETEADLIRIRREIQIMSSVRHPNIIHIYEVFENREKIVLVMEYAAGGELYDYLSERKVLSEDEARRIFRQISTAVYYCHKHNICHRDLKLENILLDENGNAKIADFGLSNVFSYESLLSTFCGSPLYASPEIVKGTPYHGPEVDCWSLGVLLYTLVYGAMPFDGSNFKRLVKQISHGDYFEPSKPSPASPLIADMLNVNPTQRADISAICSHWWLNETYSDHCLKVAKELASQTPVRLDLLLCLTTPSVNSEHVVIANNQVAGIDDVNMGSARPVRSQSLGSITPQNNVPTIVPHTIAEMKESGYEDNKSRTVRKKERSRSRSKKERSHSKSRRRSSEEETVSAGNKKIESPSTPVDDPMNLNRTFTKMPEVDESSMDESAKPQQKDGYAATEAGEPMDEAVVPASFNNKSERRGSKVLEMADKFNVVSDNNVSKIPKKAAPSALDIGKAKKEFERQTSNKQSISPASSDKSSRRSNVTTPQAPIDFPLASTVNLDKLIESYLQDEPSEPVTPSEQPATPPADASAKRPAFNTQRSREQVKNAVKVIGNAISESNGKASTLPRRKTSHAEIQLATPQYVADNFKTEVEHFVSPPTVNHRTEVVIPVSAPLPPRPLTKQSNQSKEHIIPIQVEVEPSSSSTKLSNTSSFSQSRGTIPRTSSSSLSRQSTADSDSGSNASFAGEPIRKSPREVIIPIAVEGGGFVTPNSNTLSRINSVTEDEPKDRCFTLRSTKRRQPSERSTTPLTHNDTADSLSSDEDDNFQLLTAENLFSTLLSRVRSLTQRLNNDDVRRTSAFPRSLFAHHSSIFDNPPGRRLTETRSFSRPETAPWRRNVADSNLARKDWHHYSIHSDYSNRNASDDPSNNLNDIRYPEFDHRLPRRTAPFGSSSRYSSVDNLISLCKSNESATNNSIGKCPLITIQRNEESGGSAGIVTPEENSAIENEHHDNVSDYPERRRSSKIDEEFDNFFAKYRKSSLTETAGYSPNFERRYSSNLPTSSSSSSSLYRPVTSVHRSSSIVSSHVQNSSSEKSQSNLISPPSAAVAVKPNLENGEVLDAKPPIKRRISRFLRPDFYDTPKEESKYVQPVGACENDLSSNSVRSAEDKYKRFDQVLERINKIRERQSVIEPTVLVGSKNLLKPSKSVDQFYSESPPQKKTTEQSDRLRDIAADHRRFSYIIGPPDSKSSVIDDRLPKAPKRTVVTDSSSLRLNAKQPLPLNGTASNSKTALTQNGTTATNRGTSGVATVPEKMTTKCADDRGKTAGTDTECCASYTVTLRKNKTPKIKEIIDEQKKFSTSEDSSTSDGKQLSKIMPSNRSSDDGVAVLHQGTNVNLSVNIKMSSSGQDDEDDDGECSNSDSRTMATTTNSSNSSVPSAERKTVRDYNSVLSESEESLMDRIRRRSFYSRFNLQRQRSANDNRRTVTPLVYTRSLSADHRHNRSSSSSRRGGNI